MRTRPAILGMAAVLVTAVVLLLPRFGQPPGYHAMADERTLAGIPNALNVLSNIPFAIVGIMGLVTLRRVRESFTHRTDLWSYAAVFGGVVLTSICSSYYHLAPDNARLVWDRLPMTVGFMGLLAVVIGEQVNARAGRVLLVPLVLAGVASVLDWYWSESAGSGDLRPYVLVQFGSLFMVGLMLVLYPQRNAATRYLLAGLAMYAVSKVFEVADAQIFAVGGIVSGHTLKHLVAAAGVWCLVLMIPARPLRADALSSSAVVRSGQVAS